MTVTRRVRGTCTVEDCDRPHEALGYCQRHYARVRAHGDPHVTLHIRGDDEARFKSYVSVIESGCWEWTGTRISSGYGQFSVRSKRVLAHRWAYAHYIGPIPEGLSLDHLCRNRACCNPQHVEPVTHRENVHRGKAPAAVNAARTHCKHGHPLTGSNLQVRPDGRRACLACQKARNAAARGQRAAG